ncbi:MAG: CPCC family cysteine-rich protein [Saprospiraceae bacterium]
MKTLKPYIRISSVKNLTILQVDTWELKDFLEDYLTEKCNIEYEFYQDINSELKDTNGESYNLFYSDKYTLDEIEQAVQKLDEKKICEIVDFQRIQANGKFYCPCCGYNSLDEPPNGTYNICTICFWEDDQIQFDNPSFEGGANRVSLIQGQRNFEKFGACEKEMVKNTTRPSTTDIRNPKWNKY